MLWHNENLVPNTEKRGAISMLQREYHGASIRSINTLDDRQYAVLVKGRMLHHQVEGELDIRAREGLSVIPLHICAQLERQLRQIAGV